MRDLWKRQSKQGAKHSDIADLECIFDTFAAESGRQAHLSGRIAAALMAKAPELLAQSPNIEKIDVLAAKG